MIEQKKRTRRNSMLALVLNTIGMIEMLVLPMLLIAIIWVNDTTLLKKLVLSEFIKKQHKNFIVVYGYEIL